MTDVELREYAIRLRRIAAPHGTMHPYWDIIFDIEAILKGKKSLASRDEIEKIIYEMIAKNKLEKA